MMLVVLVAVGFIIIIILAWLLIWRRRPRRLKQTEFLQQWQAVQKLCANRENWPEALIQADRLLDEALKKRHFTGKSMGERLVAAQHSFDDNDSVWYAHKLRVRIEQQPEHKLKKREIKGALLGIGQALKDLGAI